MASHVLELRKLIARQKALQGAAQRRLAAVQKSRSAAAPSIRFVERYPYLYTYCKVHIGDKFQMTFRSRVDLRKVERNLRSGQVSGVEGIFGSIFKGIKKAVSTVGKVTGLNKVVKVAGKVLGNPIVQAVVPGASLANAGLGVAKDVMGGIAAAKAKHPAARGFLERAASRAKALSQTQRRQAFTNGAKVYKLVVTPQ